MAFHINNLVEMELDYERQSLLEMDYTHSLAYYWSSIAAVASEAIGRDLNRREQDRLADYLAFNQDELLEILSGYWSQKGYYALTSHGELEITLDHLHLTDARREVINHWSDLYISDNGYGYVTHDLYCAIRIDADVVSEALLEPLDID